MGLLQLLIHLSTGKRLYLRRQRDGSWEPGAADLLAHSACQKIDTSDPNTHGQKKFGNKPGLDQEAPG